MSRFNRITSLIAASLVGMISHSSSAANALYCGQTPKKVGTGKNAEIKYLNAYLRVVRSGSTYQPVCQLQTGLDPNGPAEYNEALGVCYRLKGCGTASADVQNLETYGDSDGEKRANESFSAGSKGLADLLGNGSKWDTIRVNDSQGRPTDFRLVTTSDGQRVLQNVKTGEWKDADLKTVHASVEYEANGHIYHDSSAFESSGQQGKGDWTATRFDPETGLPVSKLISTKNANGTRVVQEQAYDEQGRPQGEPKNVDDLKKEALAKAQTKTSRKNDKSDDCEKSYEYALVVDPDNAAKYKCSKTHTIATVAQIGNQVLEGTGANLVNNLGVTAAQRTRTGTASSGYQASAQMAKGARNYQTAIGLANVAAAYALGKQSAQHQKNLGQLEASANADPTGNYGMRTSADGASAVAEQKEAAATAKKAQEAAIIAGAKGFMNASNALIQQKQMEQAAKTQTSIENLQKGTVVTFGGLPPLGQSGITAAGGGPGVGGAPDIGSVDGVGGTTGDGDLNTGSGGNLLGDGRDTGDGDGPAQVAGGAFVAGGAPPSGAAAAGGGMSMGAAGGGAAGAPVANEEPKAQYAGDLGKERYENAGTPGAGAKGGGSGGKVGGKDDGAGIDLNSLLGQFLPKTPEDIGPQGGILEYQGGANRGPASVEEPASILDKGADLFQRIHETYAEKTRQGHVGL